MISLTAFARETEYGGKVGPRNPDGSLSMSTVWVAKAGEDREEERQIGCFRLCLRHPIGSDRKIWSVYVETRLLFSGTSLTRHEAKQACEAYFDQMLDKITNDY